MGQSVYRSGLDIIRLPSQAYLIGRPDRLCCMQRRVVQFHVMCVIYGRVQCDIDKW
jgi:hypothetical protein